MNKKKSVAILGITAFVAIGVIAAFAGNDLVYQTRGANAEYSLSVSRKTVQYIGYLGWFVETSLGNRKYISTPDEDESNLYCLCGNGDGADILSELQAIKSVSVTFKFSTSSIKTSGGHFVIHVGNDTPAYSAEYHELLDITNDSSEEQTQTFTVTDPSRCQYVSLWFSGFTSDDIKTYVYSIDVEYTCS